MLLSYFYLLPLGREWGFIWAMPEGESIDHSVFGPLTIKTVGEEIECEGELKIGDSDPTQLLIYGNAADDVETILAKAADSHQRFLERHATIREQAVRELHEKYGPHLDEDDEELSVPDLVRLFKNISVIYHLQHDEAVIHISEDPDEQIVSDSGLDVSCNLTFTEVRT